MASFRRTLSPGVHDRSAQNGDVFLDSSPTHKFPSPSSYSSPVAPSCASVFSLISFMPVSVVISYIQTFLLSVCPLKSSRPVERSKTKVQVWKRALIHFILCFVVGLLTGFTPFNMTNFSTNLDSKYQEFALELKTGATNAQQDFSQIGKRGRIIETIKMDMESKKNSELEAQNEKEPEMLAIPSENADPFAGLSSVRVLDFVPRKLLIVVTPTYNRAFQAFYLNRLAHTLRLVPPPLLWIVVEMPAQSMETAAMLRRTGVMYRHLVCEKNATNIKDRGVHQRNAALAHIEQHQLDGIVYFADDDNVYTLELFDQLREIRRFGTWPVGMLADSKSKAILEGPVCNGSQVIGWHTNEKSKRLRRFHVDMSGFAFNSTILWDPQRWRRPSLQPIRQLDTVKEGFQETTFIEQVVEDESQMEGLPSNCSKVMVWHLHLEAPGLVYPPGWTLENNLDVIVPLK